MCNALTWEGALAIEIKFLLTTSATQVFDITKICIFELQLMDFARHSLISQMVSFPDCKRN
jgi:hypothetical protein